MAYQPPYRQDYRSQQVPRFASLPGAQQFPYASPQMMPELRHSKLGIASFVIGLVAGLGECMLVVIAGVMEMSTPGGIDENDPQVMVLGLLLLLGLAIAVVGVILGIAGVIESHKRKVFAILGLIFNGLILALVLVLFVIGVAAG